jgi:hypothetical protein
VVAALRNALDEGTRERLTAPLRVHVDPRLPARQAPLNGIEVHVSSRELLVASAALAELPAQAWRHELLHALAPAPPPLSRVGRQLWSTLEEGLVTFLTDVDGGQRAAASPMAAQDALEHRDGSGPQLLPLIDWLESPAYDPHPLAAGLAHELARTPAEASPFLDCLTSEPARPSPEPGLPELGLAPAGLPTELTGVFVAFVGRCPVGAQAHWATALQHWWGAPPAPGTGSARGKAAARGLESR